MQIIYGKFLHKKKLYYFLKYYYVVNKSQACDYISNIIKYNINKYDINKSIPMIFQNEESKTDSKISNSFRYINTLSHKTPNSKIPLPLTSTGTKFNLTNTSRISNNNNTTMSLTNNKTMINRRNMSYGDLRGKIQQELIPINNNNNIIKDISFINPISVPTSVKTILPSYAITSPNALNGFLYPIIISSNNENYINNSNLNNNILYNYQNNGNQINNFNSCNYNEDFLNKHICAFIHSNVKTKEDIIQNISKKHNVKLHKSFADMKIQHRPYNNNTLYKLKKIKKNQNKSFHTLNMEDSNNIFSEKQNSDSEDINDNLKKNNILTDRYNQDIRYKNSNQKFSKNTKMINKFRPNPKLKIDHYDNSYQIINNNKNKVSFSSQRKVNNYITSKNNKTTKESFNKNELSPINNIKKKNIIYSNTNKTMKMNKPIYQNNKKVMKLKSNNINSNIMQKNKKFENSKCNEGNELNKSKQNIPDSNILTTSIQSINDSKIFELANCFVDNDKNLDKFEINDILNKKRRNDKIV